MHIFSTYTICLCNLLYNAQDDQLSVKKVCLFNFFSFFWSFGQLSLLLVDIETTIKCAKDQLMVLRYPILYRTHAVGLSRAYTWDIVCLYTSKCVCLNICESYGVGSLGLSALMKGFTEVICTYTYTYAPTCLSDYMVASKIYWLFLSIFALHGYCV